jgi:hypothetical protein
MNKLPQTEAQDMSPSLVPVYEAIRALLSGPSRDDAQARHRVGVLIGEVKRGEGKYGAHAVEQLGPFSQLDEQLLKQVASIRLVAGEIKQECEQRLRVIVV